MNPPPPIAKGSSPLARGLRERPGRDLPDLRIIPARAGFTLNAVAGGNAETDHPRSRGVYKTRGRGHTYLIGSSPLARGLHAIEKGEEFVYRIIPARAGFTNDKWTADLCTQDHPRSRGVY